MGDLQIQIPRESLEAVVRDVVQQQIAAALRPSVHDEEAEQIARTLQRINAKKYITIPEFAFLFGCSEGYVGGLLEKAAQGTTDHPVPYCDLGGLCVFEREQVLAWAASAKPLKEGQKKTGGKRNHALKAVGR